MSLGEQHRILIADDEPTLRFVLRELLTPTGCQIDEAADGAEAVEKARRQGYDLYLLDMKMPNLDGLSALREIRQLYPDALAVMITAYGSQQLAIEALKAGAYDYFTKPFDLDELRVILTRALEKQTLLRQISELRQRLGSQDGFAGMIGDSEPMRRVYDMIERVTAHDVTVLLTGESGTGKELVARSIHQRSSRSAQPFVAVNCAALPDALLESELFGHERGAFTGAVQAKPGKFEAADGGTIFLDEIGEMPPPLQAKLLRVLQERTIERIGSNQSRRVDVRVIAATNCDLKQMVAHKQFREDLYFRINVIPIHLPPLRERIEDLPALVHHFLDRFNARFGKRVDSVTPEAMTVLERHAWPGNVRELENSIQRAMVMTAGSEIRPQALPDAVKSAQTVSEPNRPPTDGDPLQGNRDLFDFTEPLAAQIERLVEAEEKRRIRIALKQMEGRRQETADLLGISRKSLHNKMQKYALFDEE